MNTPALPNQPTNAAPRRVSGRTVLLVLIVAAGAYMLGRQDWVTSLTFDNGVDGSGVAATQTRTLAPFTAVDLAGASDVTVRVGAKQTVVVQADDNLINHIKTGVQDGVLVVSERGTFARNLPMSVEVTVPNLDRTRLNGSGMISVEGVHAAGSPPNLPAAASSPSPAPPTNSTPDWPAQETCSSVSLPLAPSWPRYRVPGASKCKRPRRSTRRSRAAEQSSTAATRPRSCKASTDPAPSSHANNSND